MNSPIEEIKVRLDVVETLQGYIKVLRAGANYKAVCPFHGEKTPSFFISPARQIWHCFGCGRGGDIFKFVMEIEGLDFPEALRMLAQKAGVVLKREDPAIRSEKNRLYDVCEEASLIFEHTLANTPVVKNYLKKRGVDDNVIKEFRIGFAPQNWDFLLRSLAAKRYGNGEVERAGLAVKSDDRSSWYDRFRGRIMFPITDANSRVIGFGGRIFETGTNPKKDEAKYVNTPTTTIYDKSTVLYGFDRAKQDIRSKNQVVVVEGYMDCIMSHKAGVKNTIAVSGTALTPQQLKILRRLCDTMVSSFDTDAAGDSATKRSLALASQFEFERKIAAIPSGKDPADAVLENPQSWLAAVADAKPVVEFFFEKVFREKNPNRVNGKKEISSVLLPLIVEISNEIEKDHWVGELAKRLEVSEDSIRKELKKGKTSVAMNTFASKKEIEKKIPRRRDLLEERMLTLMPLVSADIRSRELANHHIIFTSSLNQEIFAALYNNLPRTDLTDNVKEQLDMLKFKGEVLAGITKSVNEDFLNCKMELEKDSIKEQLLKIGKELQTKERGGNRQEVAILLQSFNELSNKLKTLNTNNIFKNR